MNHPTLCWRKSALIELGGYNPDLSMMEDYDIEIRTMKKYGAIYNLPDVLLNYRLHKNQLTHNLSQNTALIGERNTLLQSYLNT